MKSKFFQNSLIAVSAGLLLWGVLIIEATQSKLLLLLLGVLLFEVYVFLSLYRKNKLNVTLFFLNLSNISSTYFLFSYLLSSTNTLVFNGERIDMIDNIDSIIILFSIIPVVSLIYKIIYPKPFKLINLQEFIYPTKKLKIICFFYGILVIVNTSSNWSSFSGVVAYFSRVAYAALFLLPFLIGFWNKKLGRNTYYFCMVAILSESVLGILMGNRFTPFLNLVLLYLGYYFSQSTAVKRTLVIIGIVLGPILISIIGIMGIVRDTIGRGSSAETASLERLSLYTEAFSKYFTLSQEGDEELSEKLNLSGKGRNVNWVNLSVVSLSPYSVPYRGLENLDNEISAILGVSALSSGFTQEAIKDSEASAYDKELAIGMARRYGYGVAVGNGVEWGFIADSWSRGGAWVAVLYTFILIVLCSTFERIIANMRKEDSIIFIFILANILFFVAYGNPLYQTLHYLILRVIFISVIIRIIDVFIKKDNKIKYRTQKL